MRTDFKMESLPDHCNSVSLQFDRNMANAEWVVSGNHHPGSAAFREPPPREDDDPSSYSRLQSIPSIVNSGYRTRYPLGAVDPANLRDGSTAG